MSLLNLAALGAALTLIVVGALQVFEVTALDGADMLNVLFILAGTVFLSATLPAGLTYARSRS